MKKILYIIGYFGLLVQSMFVLFAGMMYFVEPTFEHWIESLTTFEQNNIGLPLYMVCVSLSTIISTILQLLANPLELIAALKLKNELLEARLNQLTNEK
jgi:hypothetical protein